MIIEKVLETSVDLFSPKDIYALDINTVLIDKLSNRYNNKCFSNMLILSVKKIIRYSDRIMTDNRLDGSSSVNVQFIVEGIVLHKGEVIQGCKIKRITNMGVFIENDHILGKISLDPKNKLINILKVDQYVPVIIEIARYNVGKSQILVDCRLYSPIIFEETQHYISDIMSIEDSDKLSSLLEELKVVSEKSNILATNKASEKSYNFFKEIVYPYKDENRQILNAKHFKSVDASMDSLLKINKGVITGTNFHTDNFIWLSNEENSYNVISSAYTALSSIIMQKIQYINTLNSFVEYYDTPEKTQPLLVYWKICLEYKLN